MLLLQRLVCSLQPRPRKSYKYGASKWHPDANDSMIDGFMLDIGPLLTCDHRMSVASAHFLVFFVLTDFVRHFCLDDQQRP